MGQYSSKHYIVYKSCTQLEVITSIRLRYRFERGAQKKGNVTDIVKHITKKLDVGITCLIWGIIMAWSSQYVGPYASIINSSKNTVHQTNGANWKGLTFTVVHVHCCTHFTKWFFLKNNNVQLLYSETADWWLSPSE